MDYFWRRHYLLAPQGYLLRRNELSNRMKWLSTLATAQKMKHPAAPDQINLADVTDNSPVSVQLGYGLIEMVNEDTGGP